MLRSPASLTHTFTVTAYTCRRNVEWTTDSLAEARRWFDYMVTYGHTFDTGSPVSSAELWRNGKRIEQFN